ncbi:terminase large subunit domain-containing protein [Luteithermobacter gelatinilyticus]|uniref:phage terminase large subunit family protein n=1 Tax=Luteithermobacter gelatinilyticus TaxID=2582913 RepID=UPI0011065900
MGGVSDAERLSRLEAPERQRLLQTLTEAECRALLYDWAFWSRPEQRPPVGDWFCWLVLAGRGFGKTRMAVEWLRGQVEGPSPLKAPPGAPERIALVADNRMDAVLTMIEGESGILNCSPPAQRLSFEISKKRLVWPNGAQAFIYSSEAPDQLRGPQHHVAWADEMAKWAHVEDCWSNLLFGLRLGQRPRVMVTTTPRNIPLLKDLLCQDRVVVTRGSTFDNRAHLPEAFLQEVRARYEGTRLGRQELYGDLLSDRPGTLWTRDQLEKCRCQDLPDLKRIVVAVDPPVSSGRKADSCGIVIAGVDAANRGFVLADRTVQGLGPLGWARQAVTACHAFAADRLVAEVNNGGDLVESLLRQVDPALSYRAVRATRGKIVRAEPVAALYEQGRIFHHGFLPELEEEMCALTPEGLSTGRSPDRVDALVWAMTDLLLGGTQDPRIRQI